MGRGMGGGEGGREAYAFKKIIMLPYEKSQ